MEKRIIIHPHYYYLENTFEIFKIWQGGMSFHGFLIGIFLATLLFVIINNTDHYIFVYCFLINIFWIIGSMVPMGYPYSIFQIVFIVSTIKIMFNNESYIKDD